MSHSRQGSRPFERLPGLGLRASNPEDREFLADLYADTREAELAPVPWSDEQKRAFLRHQFELQDHEYRRAYPDGSFSIVELDGAPVGRLYLHRRATETRIVDLAVVAARRGQGIGSALLSDLVETADAERRGLSIHVEMFNEGARRLYERFGFALAEDKGVYLLLFRGARETGHAP
jgi:GNAT superfamily N-acetyltransferase